MSTPAAVSSGAPESSGTRLATAERPWFKKKRWWAVGALAFIGLAGALGSDDEATVAAPESSETSAVASVEPTTDEPTPVEETTTPEPAQETTTEEPPPEPTEPELSISQEQAIRSAQSYLDFAAFSRSGLIEQLEFEGFSTDEATFAVDSITVDWNEQAARSAEAYLEFSSFSRSGLLEQLEFEGFTSEQATYGVDSVGL